MSLKQIFKDLDNKYTIRNKQEKIERAKENGYNFYSEYVINTYKTTKSISLTANVCGVSKTTIKNIIGTLSNDILEEMGIQRRPRGGRSWSRLSDDDVRYIRSFKYMNMLKFTALAAELSKKKTEECGTNIVIKPKDVDRCYNRKTHKEIK
jgi:molybdenum-dependent DNA-binding transcriptional regulator ModE